MQDSFKNAYLCFNPLPVITILFPGDYQVQKIFFRWKHAIAINC